jgi:hypothetical protein
MLIARTFIAPKRGEGIDDCQDSACPSLVSNEIAPPACLAVSDGTTTSFFSKAWADILTKRFMERSAKALEHWKDWLSEAQVEWQGAITKIVETGKPSFFVVNGFRAQRPAAATFVGICIEERGDRGWPWKANILGDSCLFHLSGQGPPKSFPLKSSDEFASVVKTAESWPKESSYSPTFYASSPDGEECLFVEGDVLVIATDALSKWILMRQESGLPIWWTLLELRTTDEFEKLIGAARDELELPLENDDVTLMVLAFGVPHSMYRELRFVPTPRVSPAAEGRPHPPAPHVGREETSPSDEQEIKVPPVATHVTSQTIATHAETGPKSETLVSRRSAWPNSVLLLLLVILAGSAFVGFVSSRRLRSDLADERFHVERLKEEITSQNRALGQELAKLKGSLGHLEEDHKKNIAALQEKLKGAEREYLVKTAEINAVHRKESENTSKTNIEERSRLQGGLDEVVRENHVLREKLAQTLATSSDAEKPAAR